MYHSVDQPDVKTLVLDASKPGALEKAATMLLAGCLAGFPTDTVYGLGALVWNATSVARIYWAKGRPPEKAIPVLMAGLEQVSLLGVELSPQMQALAGQFWPGPLTLVVPCGPQVPDVITAGSQTVAVRVPAHPVALRLFTLVGQPLAVTSANRSGQPSPVSAGEALAQLAGRIDAIIDGGVCPGGVPSTVLDLTSRTPRILRQGPVTVDDLEPVLGKVERI